MKIITTMIGLLAASIGLSQKPIEMEIEKRTIQEAVTQIFVATDSRDWSKVEQSFADEVLLDYTSMAGGEPGRLSPAEITSGWKMVLPGFDYTHHAITNFKVELNGEEATVSHYGNAEHFIADLEGDNLWTAVGTYDHHLVKTAQGWKVDEMTFHLKYMTGNMDLPRIAQEKVQANNN